MKRWLALACALLSVSCGHVSQINNANKQALEASNNTAQQVTAQQILNSFVNAGLPVYNVTILTEDTPDEVVGRPGSYIEKILWADKRAKQIKGFPPVGGKIEIFKSNDDLERRKRHLETGLPVGPPLIEYRYVFKNALIRIHEDLTPKQAAEYERVLQAM